MNDQIPGAEFGGSYRLERKLGEGGMGTVWLAHDMVLGRNVAIKILREKSLDGHAEARFRREAKILAQSKNPSILPIFAADVDTETGLSFYVMEACLFSVGELETLCRDIFKCNFPCDPVEWKDSSRALTLKDLLSCGKSLHPETVARIGLDLAGAIAHAHSLDPVVVHRDIKPSNVLFRTDGTAVLADFGIAGRIRTSKDASTTVSWEDRRAAPRFLGTPAYAAPEQLEESSEVGPAADWYAFGAVLYEALTGRRHRIYVKPSSVDPRRISRRWNGFLSALLEADPEKRLTDPVRIRETLRRLVACGTARKFPVKWPVISSVAAAAAACLTAYFVRNRGTVTECDPSPESPPVVEKRIVLPGGATLDFVWVEPGTFTMGSDDETFRDSLPAHQVAITNGFWIGKTEVTQEQWMSVMSRNPSLYHGDGLPVDSVTWDDCMRFAEKINEAFPDGGFRVRLPTEAEWEFAARGGTRSKGFLYAGGDNPDEVSWLVEEGMRRTHAVALKKPNELGLHDMSGNMCEWCLDEFAPYAEDPSDLPLFPFDMKVRRGGSFGDVEQFSTVFFRSYQRPYERSAGNGLRLCADDGTTPLPSVAASGDPAPLFSHYTGPEIYVDCSSGDDEADGLSSGTAKASIKAALEICKGGETIWVAPGVYEPFYADNPMVAIRASGGAGTACVDGNGVRICAQLAPIGTPVHMQKTVLDGFVVRNGYSEDGKTGGGGSLGIFVNCVFTGNRGSGFDVASGLKSGTAVNCVFHGNFNNAAGGAAMHSVLINCTIVRNAICGSWDCDAFNCIIAGNRRNVFEVPHSNGRILNCCVYPVASLPGGVVNVFRDPCFSDPEKNDFRLRKDSPCIDAGDVKYLRGFVDTDIGGRPRTVGKTVDIGAFETPEGLLQSP